MSKPTALNAIKVSKHFIPPHPPFPNCSTQPLYIYRSPFASSSATQIEQHLRHVGVVDPQWRYTMYTQHHFHSTTHEVLVVCQGKGRICFGGPGNPDRVEIEAGKGDVMIVPAGLAHGLLEDMGGYQMVGSYPKGGEQWDHCTGGEEGVEERIKALTWFERDPVYGDQGPVLDV